MLNHIVMMKFKPGTQDAEIDDLEKTLDNLPNAIAEIQMYEFGRNVIRSQQSYDFVIVSLFANQEALHRYQTHPEHLTVLKKTKKLCEDIITVDFEGTDAGDLKQQSAYDHLLEEFKDMGNPNPADST